MSEENKLHSKPYEGAKTNKIRYLWIASILVLLIAVSAFWLISSRQDTPQSLYTAAVTDAVTADAEEIEPLVVLTRDSQLTTWDEQGRVLLLSWHRHPERYMQGEKMSLEGSVWTFTDKEIAAWYEQNKSGVTDWNLRLEQLIGLPPEAGYTHVSGFWAAPEDVLRPAYITDITEQMQTVFPDNTDPAFLEWFEENSAYSYGESAYPWTRLGYTYDWADNGTEYGLTEFLIEKNAPVEVAFTKTTTEFIDWLEQGAITDATALTEGE